MTANTSPDNIPYPTSGDQVAPLETTLANMATGIQTAFTNYKTSVSSGVYVRYTTRSAMLADTTGPVGKHATVYADSTASYNGDYTWSGSAWLKAIGGTTLMVPSSVAGSGVTLQPLGGVTLSASATASLNGVFTTMFDNYELVYNLVLSGSSNANFRLRAGGTDTSASSYNFAYVNWNGGGATYGFSNNAATGSASGSVNAGGTVSGTIKLYSPALSAKTRWKYDSILSDTGQAASMGTGEYQATTVFDGITFSLGSGNMTGTIRIYGYNNG